MNWDDVPQLEELYGNLFGAYLNVSLEEMPTDAHVVQYYLTREPQEVVEANRAELDQLLALSLSDEELEEVLERRAGSRVYIKDFGLTPREWLERLRDWLMHGVPDEALASRETANALPQASTFPDEAEAELAVAETLHAHQDDIVNWFEGRARRLRLDHDLGRPLGTLVRYDSDEEFHPTCARVIIVRDPSFEPSGWRILTGYPILRVGRTEVRERFPHLDLLFGCYFNQDWEDEHGHERFVVETFVAENPRDLVERTASEVSALRELPMEEPQLGELLIYDLGAEYAAPKVGKTYRQFLMDVEMRLRRTLAS